jgi:hypothetical protein
MTMRIDLPPTIGFTDEDLSLDLDLRLVPTDFESEIHMSDEVHTTFASETGSCGSCVTCDTSVCCSPTCGGNAMMFL